MTRILIAENDRKFRELISFALRFAGFITLNSSSAEESLSMARYHQPDLILLDENLLKINGVEAYSVLKADPETTFIPVIILTTRNHLSDAQIEHQIRAEEYILISSSPDQIVRQVTHFLHRAKKLNP